MLIARYLCVSGKLRWQQHATTVTTRKCGFRKQFRYLVRIICAHYCYLIVWKVTWSDVIQQMSVRILDKATQELYIKCPAFKLYLLKEMSSPIRILNSLSLSFRHNSPNFSININTGFFGGNRRSDYCGATLEICTSIHVLLDWLIDLVLWIQKVAMWGIFYPRLTKNIWKNYKICIGQ